MPGKLVRARIGKNYMVEPTSYHLGIIADDDSFGPLFDQLQELKQLEDSFFTWSCQKKADVSGFMFKVAGSLETMDQLSAWINDWEAKNVQ